MRTSRPQPIRLRCRGEDADHRADRVTDDDYVGEVELTADFEDVLGVAFERGVSVRVPGRMIRAAEAHVIEEDDPVILRESGPDVPPHALITAEAVRREHRLCIVRPMLDGVVTRQKTRVPSL